MGIIKTEAIVLGALPFGETSKVVRLVTRDFGLQSLLAKGVQRPQSRAGGVLETFNHIAVIYYRSPHRTLFTLSSAELLTAFPQLGQDLARFAAASVMIELVRVLTTQDEPHPEAFDLLRRALAQVAIVAAPGVESTLWAFEWRFLSLLGYEPSLLACLRCRRPAAEEVELRFSAEGGGVVCSDCHGYFPESLPLPRGVLSSLLLLVRGDLELANRVRLVEGEAQLLRHLLTQFLFARGALERPLRTPGFYLKFARL